MSNDKVLETVWLPDGWCFERLAGGRMRVSKYRIPNPSVHEQPQARITLSADEWRKVSAAATPPKETK